jgi:hypothetical protein
VNIVKKTASAILLAAVIVALAAPCVQAEKSVQAQKTASPALTLLYFYSDG